MLCFTFQKDNVGTAFQDIHVKKWEFSGHPKIQKPILLSVRKNTKENISAVQRNAS